MKVSKNSRDMSRWFLDIFDCKELRHLPDAVYKKILENDTNIYEEYIKEYPELKKDSLGEFFETYFADTNFLGQNFTPNDLSLLITELILLESKEPHKEMMDECAGIGSLIIPYWVHNPDVMVYAREISNSTIPFLLFNMAVRNMNGVVVHGDTLTLDFNTIYILTKGEKFSNVKEFNFKKALQSIDPLFMVKFMKNYLPGSFESGLMDE